MRLPFRQAGADDMRWNTYIGVIIINMYCSLYDFIVSQNSSSYRYYCGRPLSLCAIGVSVDDDDVLFLLLSYSSALARQRWNTIHPVCIHLEILSEDDDLFLAPLLYFRRYLFSFPQVSPSVATQRTSAQPESDQS